MGHIYLMHYYTIGRRLAREWAHYRYGVFDEGGVPGDLMHPSGYMTFEVEKTAKVVRPNVCSHKLVVNGEWNKYKNRFLIAIRSDKIFSVGIVLDGIKFVLCEINDTRLK